ncbi:hypothetical protein J6590_084384 [Homalodisca vitripennis]|nr:hypothetical protein J6590_084384 [Homalodisca vitripennis]
MELDSEANKRNLYYNKDALSTVLSAIVGGTARALWLLNKRPIVSPTTPVGPRSRGALRMRVWCVRSSLRGDACDKLESDPFFSTSAIFSVPLVTFSLGGREIEELRCGNSCSERRHDAQLSRHAAQGRCAYFKSF